MNYKKLILAISIPLLVGGVSGYFTASSIENWYVYLNKPSFNPPNWIFGPMWTLLYILMGISLYIIWNNKIVTTTIKQKAIFAFGVQLFLNFLWSFLFFYFKNPLFALIDIVLMILGIMYMIFCFKPISKTAAYLQIPYLFWVSFATLLNFYIWKLN